MLAGQSTLIDRLHDRWAVFLLAFPIIGTFYSPETYFEGTALAVPVTPPFLIVCSLYIIVALVWAGRQQRLRHEPLSYLFVLFAFASAAWSDDAHYSLQRALRLLPVVGLAVLYAQIFPLPRIFRIMTIAFLISAVISTVMSTAFPALGLDRLGAVYANAWRGALINKNQTGFVYALGLMVGLFSWYTGAISYRLGLPTAALCGLVVMMSQSTTSVLAAFLALIPALTLWAMRREAASLRILAVTTMALTALLAVFIVIRVPDVLELIGKNASFNGRTPIWEAAWSLITSRPVLGHGYGFWGIDSAARSMAWSMSGQREPHSHNSWLDLGVQLGAVGFFLVALLTVVTLGQVFNASVVKGVPEGVLCLALLLTLLIRSMSEVEFTEPANFGLFWLVWIALVARQSLRGSAGGRVVTPGDPGRLD